MVSDSLCNRACFLRASASSAEDGDSSVVSLQARFSDLLLLLRCVLRLLLCVDRCARVCENRCIGVCSARERTAALRAAERTLLVAISTQQLLLRACISCEMLRIRSCSCSSTTVGERALAFRPRCSRVCWMLCCSR